MASRDALVRPRSAVRPRLSGGADDDSDYNKKEKRYLRAVELYTSSPQRALHAAKVRSMQRTVGEVYAMPTKASQPNLHSIVHSADTCDPYACTDTTPCSSRQRAASMCRSKTLLPHRRVEC